jgi:hypothetical protein
LSEVDDDARVTLRDAPEREVELLAAVTLQGVQHFAGEALAVHSREDVDAAAHVTADDGAVLVAGPDLAVHHDPEVTVLRRELGLGIPRDPGRVT